MYIGVYNVYNVYNGVGRKLRQVADVSLSPPPADYLLILILSILLNMCPKWKVYDQMKSSMIGAGALVVKNALGAVPG